MDDKYMQASMGLKFLAHVVVIWPAYAQQCLLQQENVIEDKTMSVY